MNKKQKHYFFVALLIILVIFAELSLQAYYRIRNGSFLYNRMTLPIYSKDDYRYFSLKPNLNYRHQTNEFSVTYYTNSQGFRTDYLMNNFTKDKDEKIYRILFLGPSFTFGWANNYEDTYASIIGGNIILNDKKIEIMNIGTPAQPVRSQLCWFQNIGYQFKPDMIIQTVYGFPDMLLDSNCQKLSSPPSVHDGYLYHLQPSFKMKLISHAKNCAIVFYGWYLYQYIFSKTDHPVGLGTELYEQHDAKLIEINSEHIIEKYRQYISFVRQTLHTDIPIVFIHIPFSYTVRPSDLSRWEHRGFANPYKLRRKANDISKLLEQHQITYINPTDELILRDKETRMYYYLDIHFTPAGNNVVATKAIPLIHKLIEEY